MVLGLADRGRMQITHRRTRARRRLRAVAARVQSDAAAAELGIVDFAAGEPVGQHPIRTICGQLLRTG